MFAPPPQYFHGGGDDCPPAPQDRRLCLTPAHFVQHINTYVVFVKKDL